MLNYFYKVKRVVKVQDGDTVTLELDLGFGVSVTHKFRLMDFDAPETYRPKTEAERKAGIRVKKYLKRLLNRKKGILLVESSKLGTYGRYNGRLWRAETNNVTIHKLGKSLNEQIINFMNKYKLTKEHCR